MEKLECITKLIIELMVSFSVFAVLMVAGFIKFMKHMHDTRKEMNETFGKLIEHVNEIRERIMPNMDLKDMPDIKGMSEEEYKELAKMEVLDAGSPYGIDFIELTEEEKKLLEELDDIQSSFFTNIDKKENEETS